MPGLDVTNVIVTIDEKVFEMCDALNGLYALADWWTYDCASCPIDNEGRAPCCMFDTCREKIMAWALAKGKATCDGA